MIYAKIENGRQIFSDCHAVIVNGRYISNPTSEQIAEAGWEEYTPPVKRHETPDMAEMMQAVKTMLASSTEALSDEDALAVAALFPTWASKVGEQVSVGERLWYDEKLYKVVQAHTAQQDWTPDATPALYTEVSIEEWPAWVQPTGVQDAYNTGDKVTFEGRHYISLIDGNTWSPAAYPQGWEESE